MVDDAELIASADEIEQLLDELRAMLPPAGYERVVQVVQRVVGLYAQGLERMLGIARDTEAAQVFEDRACADELVASLLVLHGLHPQPTEQRVRQALSRLAERVDGAKLELVGVDGQERVHVRATGSSTPQLLDRMIRRAIEEAAPEITEIVLDGLAAPRPPDGLVQIRTRPREVDR